jgi:Na+/melibiose symporter-like transporter
VADARRFRMRDIAFRFGAAWLLVVTTWNPTGLSFWQWVTSMGKADALGPIHLFVGVLLLIAWVVFLSATFRSLGLFGLGLVVALFGSFVWWLADSGLLPSESEGAMTWIVLGCIAGVLSIGMSWSHVWRRLSGQIDVDDVDSG